MASAVNLSLSSCQTKANLVVTLTAADGSLVGGLVLSGHTDVVPVDGQNWSYPPFASYNKTWTPSLKTLLPQDFHYCIFQPADL